MLFIGSFLIIVVLLLGYSAWLYDECGDDFMDFALTFMSPAAGIICIAIMWGAFIKDWELAMSFNWTLASTIIIFLLSLVTWLVSLLMYGIAYGAHPDDD